MQRRRPYWKCAEKKRAGFALVEWSAPWGSDDGCHPKYLRFFDFLEVNFVLDLRPSTN